MPLVKNNRTWRFKLRTILLAVSLAVLVIPLGGVYIFRFYEGELVKQTEVELIAQAALIAAVYKREVETRDEARRSCRVIMAIKLRCRRRGMITFSR